MLAAIFNLPMNVKNIFGLPVRAAHLVLRGVHRPIDVDNPPRLCCSPPLGPDHLPSHALAGNCNEETYDATCSFRSSPAAQRADSAAEWLQSGERHSYGSIIGWLGRDVPDGVLGLIRRDEVAGLFEVLDLGRKGERPWA